MVRSGINKALVQDACTAPLQRGRRPSIDAVRIELGNRFENHYRPLP
jgi:hypothetical protein